MFIEIINAKYSKKNSKTIFELIEVIEFHNWLSLKARRK